jgi:hypothetical protein
LSELPAFGRGDIGFHGFRKEQEISAGQTTLSVPTGADTAIFVLPAGAQGRLGSYFANTSLMQERDRKILHYAAVCIKTYLYSGFDLFAGP